MGGWGWHRQLAGALLTRLLGGGFGMYCVDRRKKWVERRPAKRALGNSNYANGARVAFFQLSAAGFSSVEAALVVGLK